MTISIVEHQLPYGTYEYESYGVTFFGDEINTLLTHTPAMVDAWISEIERIYPRSLHRLIVGLDVEWRPNFNRNFRNPVATIQLCVAQRCLIFQLIHALFIPVSLIHFLLDAHYTFVGVGIDADVKKLSDEYGLRVSNTVDLRGLAARVLGMSELRNAGLKDLARNVLGKVIEKPRSVTLSGWDQRWLNYDQVQYACVDAFVSFEIGRSLNASG